MKFGDFRRDFGQYTRVATSGRNGEEATKLQFQVKTISTIMRELGHTHLDMLKIDTEGGEFEDVLGLASDGVLEHVDAFCAEFHYFSAFNNEGVKIWDGPKGRYGKCGFGEMRYVGRDGIRADPPR